MRPFGNSGNVREGLNDRWSIVYIVAVLCIYISHLRFWSIEYKVGFYDSYASFSKILTILNNV